MTEVQAAAERVVRIVSGDGLIPVYGEATVEACGNAYAQDLTTLAMAYLRTYGYVERTDG